ncbi:hypothetical protein I551_8743 [Mycobacterium ulcerans str. Harvey]|uniref:Uncharacterized protein n=1 Tax=Mycobacterium ulcerans str. Harvey TaxID=1299332 RepID=A0ABN0R9X6_MYCUL|nr:hypothetical protein I551_8743 [Mycobacterium ulcerans str. Harvey]
MTFRGNAFDAAAYESVLSALLSDGWLGQLRRYAAAAPCM